MNLWLAFAEGAAEGAHGGGEGGGHGGSLLVETLNKVTGLHMPEHIVLAVISLLVCTVGLYLFRGKLSVDRPSNSQQLLEVVVTGIRGMLDDIVGPYGQRYLPLIGAFAVFIFVSNIMGLIPGLGAPSGNINVTLALGILSFGYYVFKGFQQQGIGYLKHFMNGLTSGPLILVGVVVFVFELISNFVRPFTLGIRLFLNIFADHQIGGAFEQIMPWFLPIVLPLPLATFVAIVQTMVFIMLSMIYLAETVPHEEHEHEEHHHAEPAAAH